MRTTWLVTALACLSSTSCMTRLHVRAEVYEREVSIELLEDASARLDELYDGLGIRAAALFEERVRPIAGAFPQIYSSGALDGGDFGKKVERRVRNGTVTQYERARSELARATEEAAKTGSRNQARGALHILGRALTALEAEARRAVEKAVTDRQEAAIKDVIDIYVPAKPAIVALLAGKTAAQIKGAFGSTPEAPDTVMVHVSQMRDTLQAYYGETLTTGNIDVAYARLEQVGPKLVRELTDGISAVVEERASDVRSITVQAVNLADPMIATIIGDEKNWRESVSVVDAWTFIGNSEIAIKMESLGEYHLKDVTLDNDGAAEAAFDILGQTVSVLAAAYGLPASPGSDEQDNDNDGMTSSGISGPTLRGQIRAIDGKNAIRGERMTQIFLDVLAIVPTVPDDLPNPPPAAPGPANHLMQIKASRDAFVNALNTLAGQIEEGK